MCLEGVGAAFCALEHSTPHRCARNVKLFELLSATGAPLCSAPIPYGGTRLSFPPRSRCRVRRAACRYFANFAELCIIPFVYLSPEREISAVAVSPCGLIYPVFLHTTLRASSLTFCIHDISSSSISFYEKREKDFTLFYACEPDSAIRHVNFVNAREKLSGVS